MNGQNLPATTEIHQQKRKKFFTKDSITDYGPGPLMPTVAFHVFGRVNSALPLSYACHLKGLTSSLWDKGFCGQPLHFSAHVKCLQMANAKNLLPAALSKDWTAACFQIREQEQILTPLVCQHDCFTALAVQSTCLIENLITDHVSHQA